MKIEVQLAHDYVGSYRYVGSYSQSWVEGLCLRVLSHLTLSEYLNILQKGSSSQSANSHFFSFTFFLIFLSSQTEPWTIVPQMRNLFDFPLHWKTAWTAGILYIRGPVCWMWWLITQNPRTCMAEAGRWFYSEFEVSLKKVLKAWGLKENFASKNKTKQSLCAVVESWALTNMFCACGIKRNSQAFSTLCSTSYSRHRWHFFLKKQTFLAPNSFHLWCWRWTPLVIPLMKSLSPEVPCLKACRGWLGM